MAIKRLTRDSKQQQKCGDTIALQQSKHAQQQCVNQGTSDDAASSSFGSSISQSMRLPTWLSPLEAVW